MAWEFNLLRLGMKSWLLYNWIFAAMFLENIGMLNPNFDVVEMFFAKDLVNLCLRIDELKNNWRHSIIQMVFKKRILENPK